jgi:DNA-binding response OmpR family regulator
MFPDMSFQFSVDGMTSTRAIREYEDTNKLAKCRIVALTGLASASARLEALSSGVDYFMTKPMNFRTLESLLKKSDERNRKYSESQLWKGSVKDKKVAEEDGTERPDQSEIIPRQEAS